MPKYYRSLFDKDEVYEVTEVEDEFEEVKVLEDEDDEEKVTMKDCIRAIDRLTDALLRGGVFDRKGKKSMSEEDEEVEVIEEEDVEVIEDEEIEVIEDNDVEIIEDEEVKVLEDEDDESKEVKDAYRRFTRIGDSNKPDPAGAAQVAFQNRYNNVANK